MSEYAERDIIEQGDYYSRHTSAMVGEGLHSKSDIAAEMAHRDIQIDTLRQQFGQAEARYEACKLQAQIWKQEARAQSATIAEIYQEVTGKTGEPGDWNGARPIKAAIFRKQAEAVEEAARVCMPGPCGPPDDPPAGYQEFCEGVASVHDYAQRLRQQADEMEKNDE